MKGDSWSGNIFLKVRVRSHFLAGGGTDQTGVIHGPSTGQQGQGPLESAGFLTPRCQARVQGPGAGRNPKDVFRRNRLRGANQLWGRCSQCIHHAPTRNSSRPVHQGTWNFTRVRSPLSPRGGRKGRADPLTEASCPLRSLPFFSLSKQVAWLRVMDPINYE